MPLRSRTPCCLACGYPLRQLEGRRCPECGHPFDLDDPASYAGGRRRILARPIHYVVGVPPIAAGLYVAYLHCFGVIFDNPAAPLLPRLVVWVLSFPLLYVSLIGGDWAFESLVAFNALLFANLVLWASAAITAGALIHGRLSRPRPMSA